MGRGKNFLGEERSPRTPYFAYIIFKKRFYEQHDTTPLILLIVLLLPP